MSLILGVLGGMAAALAMTFMKVFTTALNVLVVVAEILAKIVVARVQSRAMAF